MLYLHNDIFLLISYAMTG